MLSDPHKIRCFVCDVKHAWANIKHGKVAKWTLIVHLIYYVHATWAESGLHIVTSAACAVALVFDLFYDER